MTVADTEINTLVIKVIKDAFPSHEVLGEEASDYKIRDKYVWVCDPIEGTIPKLIIKRGVDKFNTSFLIYDIM